MKNIAILGSTGSIGVNTLKVVSDFPHKFSVVGLTANSNIELLEKQVKQFHPQVVAVKDESKLRDLRERIDKSQTKVYGGLDGLVSVSTHENVDLVVAAIAGSCGLIPIIESIKMGKEIALANKEAMVMAGHLIVNCAEEKGVEIVPIDSEHSAIFQCLQGRSRDELKKIYLTGSGGPLYGLAKERFDSVSPEEALSHPKWAMGKKISIDSATLMNKGFEVIEASWLFDCPVEKIEVLIHPEAIVHSMVEFIDGSIIAQLGITDMRLPIQYALSFPERLHSRLPCIDFSNLKTLTFRPPDWDKFPCLGIAYNAAHIGGTAITVLNAADEEAVGAFLGGRIKLTGIPEVIEEVMRKHHSINNSTLEEVLEADRWAREQAKLVIGQ